MRIGFIGLGNMGGHMAANQIKGQRRVSAFDLSAEAVARAVEAGCETGSSAGETVREADAVITMLPAGAHVRKVMIQDVLPNVRPGTLLVDCSTIDVETARELSDIAAKAGMRYADAPVSGGMMGAEAATLTFMVGCRDDETFTAVEEAVRPMGRAVIRAGGPGAGQAAKICNNMLLGISMLGTCEAFALAEKLGLDWQRFYDITSKSSGQCWSVTTNCPIPGPVPNSPANFDYRAGFATAMILKDLKLAQAAAASAGASAPMGAQAEGLFALFDQLGYGNKDFSAIIQLFRGRLAELA
ncbi:MAG TPA: 3-hydroxyisobutyrate dehydrogenase [Caulobacteraceae bacterium]